MIDWLNAAATIIVAGSAYHLYTRQTQDKKRDAALAIVMEIRECEKNIEILKSGPLNLDLYIRLLPVNSWLSYSHLFVKDLDSDELALINSFYNTCESIDGAMKELSSATQIATKASAIQHTICQIAKDCESKEEFPKKRDLFLSIISPDTTIFVAHAHTTVIQQRLQNIRFVTTSSAGTKLKKIALE